MLFFYTQVINALHCTFSLAQTTLKNQSPIRVPVTGLDLTPYTLSGKLHGADEPVGPVVYDLTGLCVHTGAHAATLQPILVDIVRRIVMVVQLYSAMWNQAVVMYQLLEWGLSVDRVLLGLLEMEASV